MHMSGISMQDDNRRHQSLQVLERDAGNITFGLSRRGTLLSLFACPTAASITSCMNPDAHALSEARCLEVLLRIIQVSFSKKGHFRDRREQADVLNRQQRVYVLTPWSSAALDF